MHINTIHYLWNYIFYIYGLFKKDSTEYTGLEYAIFDMIEKEDICW
jgi:inositol 1,4,5-triphosphate receptor type 1/inositol 1,4,5-triphosphate receptor type 3